MGVCVGRVLNVECGRIYVSDYNEMTAVENANDELTMGVVSSYPIRNVCRLLHSHSVE